MQRDVQACTGGDEVGNTAAWTGAGVKVQEWYSLDSHASCCTGNIHKASVAFKLVWVYWMLQGYDRLACSVTRHGFAHVQSIFSSSIVTYHSAIDNVAHLQANTAPCQICVSPDRGFHQVAVCSLA